jgi:hypothetical protein
MKLSIFLLWIEKKIAKEIEILAKDKESLSKIIEHLQNFSILDYLSFIILNSFNKICLRL